ncbi:MAG TPA: dihydroorotate dehydrogenase-like protein [Chloroflexi bacterium]|jgi:dihydroorotate dehydrogenase (fumarate)|nr:dihydroorotate dehydrogenase-like protein [Chloroflexota bacterium]
MDLTTQYLGMTLKNPLVPSASPLSRSLDLVRRMEDAGASAVVMYSLFEEQVILESYQLDHYLDYFTEAFAEALTWYPAQREYHIGPDEHLKHIRRIKEAVDIPIIGSLNGISTGGWIDYARGMQEAGADALELNVYYLPTSPAMSGDSVEQMCLNVLTAVKENVSIPVAVKLSPYYSAIGHMVARLAEAGADGVVMFNRFYQSDFDLDTLQVVPSLTLSTSDELRLPLRWVAILYGRVPVDMAITTGVHTYRDVLKGLMAGARVTMMTSELLQNGVERIGEILGEMTRWMEARGYESVKQMQGSMSQQKVGDPAAFERANYMRVLQSWRPDPAGQLYREMLT